MTPTPRAIGIATAGSRASKRAAAIGVRLAMAREASPHLPADLVAGDLVRRPVRAVRSDEDLTHARREMLRWRIGQVAVVDGSGDLRGLLSLHDIVAYAGFRPLRPGATPGGTRVAKVLHTPVVLDADARLATVARALATQPAGAALVLGADPPGILTPTDLLTALAANYPGRLQVADVARDVIPVVPRAASPAAAWKALAVHDAEEAFVTDGQAGPTATLRGAHTGEAEGWGIVGRINAATIAASAWFTDRLAGKTRDRPVPRTRRVEAAGRKGPPRVGFVGAPVGDMVDRRVPVVRPEDDAATAAHLMLAARASGLAVYRRGVLPGYLDHRELLEGWTRRLPAAAARGAGDRR
jgi:CBS domain-containing protein